MSEKVVMTNVKRGEIYMCDMTLTKGSEQGGTQRPVIVLSNNVGNYYSPVITVAALTSQCKSKLPTHVTIGIEHGMEKESIILTEQLRTIDKSRLMFKITSLDDDMMEKVDYAVQVSLGLVQMPQRKQVTVPGVNITRREAVAV